MDLNGVYASVCFPSFLPGFAGQRLQQLTDDPELALACVRAWNDWVIEDWAAYAPGRMIPLQIPYLLDPEVGAEEVRRNAARGFKAMTFSEAPHLLGLPSLHTGHWDPLMAACEETGTVVCLHVGSSGTSPATSPDAPSDTIGVLFFGYAMFAAVDWLYSRIPVRFPDLSICLSEGGIGWVAGLLDRLEHVRKYDAMYGTWNDVALSPADTFRRNFWVCAIDDPSAFLQRDVIGIEQHPGRVRLPARRLHVADHAGAARRAARGSVRRRDRARHVGERVGAVPSPGARRGAARPECLLTRAEPIDTPVGPVRRHSRRRGRCASAACRTRAPSGGVCPSRSRGPSRSTRPRPGAAPPQTVGGLDLVPGMIAVAQTEALPHRRDLHARARRLASRCSCGCPGGSYRIGGASLPTYDGSRLARARRRGRRAATTGSGALGWLAADGRAVEPRPARPRAPRSSGCAPTSPRSAAIPTASCSWASRRARACVAHLLATGDVPVAGAILQSGAPAGHARRRRRGVGRRAVPRRRRCGVASTTLRRRAGRRAPRRAGADGRRRRWPRSA